MAAHASEELVSLQETYGKQLRPPRAPPSKSDIRLSLGFGYLVYENVSGWCGERSSIRLSRFRRHSFVRATPSTEDFVKKVAISDMFEIQSSQTALTKQPEKGIRRRLSTPSTRRFRVN